MAAPYILAIDQGTTGSTAVVLSLGAEVLGRATQEFPQHFPHPGWVEHDVDELWESVLLSMGEALRRAQVKPNDCRAIGITNQRETTVLWDRETGNTIHRAIVWQDRRTAERCERLREQGLEPKIRERTGLVLDPYFSATKIEWLLDAVDGARARAEQGGLAFGTIDSLLVHRLSRGAVHVTDVSNASRTLLFDIRRGEWDEELARLFRVPLAVLPQIRGNAEIYGHTSRVPGMADGVAISGMAGDQQAALFGQACFRPGEAKCTYGTGAFLLVNTGTTPVFSQHGLVTTIAWNVGGETTFALEGSAFIAGAAVQWLRDGLGVISSASEIEALAKQVDSSGDLVFVPALTGFGAPYWDPHARGLICGISRDTTVAHLARATLEGIAFQIADLAEAMTQDRGQPLARLRVDGGAACNDLLMQRQADLLNVEIDRPECLETTALGAAYLAALGAGLFSSLDGISKAHRIARRFQPSMDKSTREGHLEGWRLAVRRARII